MSEQPDLLTRIKAIERRLGLLETEGMSGLAGTDQTIKGSHDRLDALMGAGKTAVPACVLYNNANISINNASWTNISGFNTELTDTDTMHDPSTNPGRITIKTAGLYVYGYSIVWDSASVWRGAIVQLNGSVSLPPYTSQLLASANYAGLAASSIRVFSVADYLELRVHQSSGGALNILALAYSSPIFWAAKIG